MSVFWDIVKAFLVGGAICAVVQIIIDKTALTPARILVGLVTLGVILGALGVYKPFIDFAGCGASTPLTGFGATLADGVRKAVDERGLIGALTGGFTGSAGGIAAAIFFGYFFALMFKSKPRD
jgi:stage V sporulation protein AE